ncbi:SAC3/GANP/Nin1/mts3/eIF-3 p25 family [Striga hermonthica]|uniref:SAC3/GANP/Nin1/mts3/eIF-3 p25 family n=1 Tax=Striga hermonthica TaxID=68872 RepID=A0A9N7RQN8_STRHE|nr:SAC3/GANP/Nin1/mts3/eIF-3 p25 family [Striga hermonthica]
MNFGGFGKNSGPTTPPRAQTPFGHFSRPPSPSPSRPVSPRSSLDYSDLGISEGTFSSRLAPSHPFPGTLSSNGSPLRWGDAPASSSKDHGAQTFQRPPSFRPEVPSHNSKATSSTRTTESQYIERTYSPYSQSPNETLRNSRSVIESYKSHLVPHQSRSPPPVFQNYPSVGGQNPPSTKVQQHPFPNPVQGNRSKTSSSVLITRGNIQPRPLFKPKYEDGLLPMRMRSPTLTSTGGVSPENTVSYSDGHQRSLIHYRDLDAPEAMPSPPLGSGSSLPNRESARPLAGNRTPSPPNVRAHQPNQSISIASPLVRAGMSPALTKAGAYNSGSTLQIKHADVSLPKRTRSPTIPSTSGGVLQDSPIASDSHNRSEIAVDRTMHFPAVKRTKIPLSASSDQVFEENFDPSIEIERELLAKEKRLARFKDELNQPAQSHSTFGSQNTPAKRQHQSMSGRPKLSEDVTIEGTADPAGGNVSLTNEGLSSSSIAGLCPDMCPESERAERERKGDLDQYERLDGDRNLTSEFLAVKKYTRTAEREADLIRPLPILQKTMDYLLSLLDEPYDDRFLGLYNFLWDRMRAIRMDLRMQHIFNLEAINMLEQMIRLHVIAMHELCEYNKGEGFSEGFDAHLNIEQMNKTSVELFQLYDDHRKKGIHVPSEREFRGYYALLKLDKHPGYKVEPAELSLDLAKMTPEMRQTPEVLFARDVARACRTGNFIAFFRLSRKASYLQACLMHAHFSKLRTQALASLHCGLQINQGIPITLVAKWLGMEDEEIENLVEYYGFSVKDFEEPYMVKENAFFNLENDFPVKRSKLVIYKRSRMIVGDVQYACQNESYAEDEIKGFQPKAVPETIPSHTRSSLPASTTQLHVENLHDLGTIFSPKGSVKKHMDKASIALTTPEIDMVGDEVQLVPTSPLVLDFSNSSYEHHQSGAKSAHKPKFEPSFRNSFGRVKPMLEATTAPMTLETIDETRFPVISHDSVVHSPITQPKFTEDIEEDEQILLMEEEDEQTLLMKENKSDEVTTSYYDKEVEEARLKLMLRIWKRHTAKKRELREHKQLTASAALSLLSMGPPVRRFEIQSSSFGTININHVMSERHKIQERSWSLLNPSEVGAPKLLEKNKDAKCLCWKLLILSQTEQKTKPSNEAASISSTDSWLYSKLMPEKNDADGDLLVSSPGRLSIWKNWLSSSSADPTLCLSVIRNITFEQQNEATAGSSAVLFVLSDYIPMEFQKKGLHDFVMSLPSGSRLPLLVLSGSSKDEASPSSIAYALGMDEIDKSRVVNFYVTFLKDSIKKLDGFLSDEHLREGLEWLASEMPPQVVVRGTKTRELILSHLNSTYEIFYDEMNIHRFGPDDCISAFNNSLDQSMKKVADAARANPTGWPCPEIELLEGSKEEKIAAAWYLPRVGWSSQSRTELLMRTLNDLKLPALGDDLCWLSEGCNIGRDSEGKKSRLENCLTEYLSKSSGMMDIDLARKEAGVLLQKFTRLELPNTTYFIVPNWVSIFQRIFNWRLMSLNSGEVSSTYVLEHDYITSLSCESVDELESQVITFHPPSTVCPLLDELVEVGYQTNESNYMEYEAIRPFSSPPMVSFGATCDDEDDENAILLANKGKFSGKSCDHLATEENNERGLSMNVVKTTPEADKLSELLDKCSILQNLIDEKLSIYF